MKEKKTLILYVQSRRPRRLWKLQLSEEDLECFKEENFAFLIPDECGEPQMVTIPFQTQAVDV